jgi:ornithine carbamoyltransferase
MHIAPPPSPRGEAVSDHGDDDDALVFLRDDLGIDVGPAHAHGHEHALPTPPPGLEGHMRHFLEVDDLSVPELLHVLDLADLTQPPPLMQGMGAALVFEKPSLRTRNSTEMAVVQLGGHPVTIGAAEVGLGTRETPEDVARTLGAYHAVLCARVFEHETLERMAATDAVPIVNLLSDRSHPLQALADILTLGRRFGRLRDLTVTYVGDPNNVSRSLAICLTMLGSRLRIASPPGYACPDIDIDHVRALGGEIELYTRPEDAVRDADAVYTDVWTSMGKEDEVESRRMAFEGFTVDRRLMAMAADHAVFMHCLPAHRGEEVTADVLEAPASLVWQQAENRMHTVRGLLAFLLGDVNTAVGFLQR